MDIWYVTGGEVFIQPRPVITTVEVEKSSEHSVWIKGKRLKRLSAWDMHFETFEEAKAYLIERSNLHLKKCREALELAENIDAKIKALNCRGRDD